MKQSIFLLTLITLFFSACIKDDIIDDRVPERLNITNEIDSLQVGMTFQIETAFFNNIGQRTEPAIDWSSSDEDIANINANGLLTAVGPGNVNILARVTLEDNTVITDEFDLAISEEEIIIIEEPEEPAVRSGIIETTSFYTLTGNFTLTEVGDDLLLEIDETYEASTGLPGFYLYLTNNPNSIANAFEISMINTFEGAHSYTIPDVGIDDFSHLLFYCKPFSVKVGEGVIN